MLGYLAGRASERKLRLFACACARRVWSLMTHPCSREAVLVAERFADGTADRRALAAARGTVRADLRGRVRRAVHEDALGETGNRARAEARAAAWAGAWDTARDVLRAAAQDAARDASNAAAVTLCCVWGTSLTKTEEDARQAALLSDLVGNPFAPAPVETSW